MKKITLLMALAIFAIAHSFAQEKEETPQEQEELLLTAKDSIPEELVLTAKDSIIVSSYMAGLGYNFVDDSGDVLDDFFLIEKEWNSVFFPSRINFGRYFESGIGLEAIAAYNKYGIGKNIDGIINTEEKDYYSIDARLTYDLNKIIGQTGWFDPYVGAGLGYTDANNIGRASINAIAGFRVWFSDHWALDLNTTGKWSQGSSEASNHIQHAAGVVYQWDVEKALSRKGKKKYEEIQKIENEKQRVLDSIANANELKEAALLAERQEEEARIAEAQKEKDRLAAIEKAKLDAENAQKAKMEERISQLGTVYYALNSSFLNNESKRVLDAIATLLTNEPEVALKITSHTDSRETDEYNDWLSQRRQNSAIKYLISKGIAAERLTGESFGERSLTNECDDNTPCSEEKHQLNRRSEFTVIKI